MVRASEGSARRGGRESSELDFPLLRASADALQDPQVILEPVRDPCGRIIDFVYREVNTATCDYLGISRDELIGRGVVETKPDIGETLLAGWIRVLDTGEPLVLDDFSHDNEILRDTRRYDIRVTRSTPTTLTLTWRDVTERSNLIRAIAESERTYRLLAENFNDVVLHVRDGAVVWASPSVDAVLGAADEHWVGRQIREIVPPEDAPTFDRRLATLAAGGTVKERIRVVSLDGVIRWIDLHAKPFRNDAGHRDGFTAAMRVIDDQVAAEEAIKRASRQKARDDARYRRSMNDAAVGMCLITTDGRLEDVNDAMGRIFDLDAAAMNETHWQDYIAREYLDEERDNFNAILEGRSDSYRMLQRFSRADGCEVWGELSVSAVHDDDDHLEGLIALITDVTAEVQTRLELELRNEENLKLIQRLDQQNEQIVTSEKRYRLLAQNAGDVVCHLREDRVVWISPSVEAALGAPPEFWLGRKVLDFVPAEDVSACTALLSKLAAGGTVRGRIRVVAPDSRVHWLDLHATPFYDDGHQDGVSATLRLIDNEVAAEQAAKEARRLQARADALYRRSVDRAVVGMCLADLDGNLVEVNEAMCRFFGYDANSLRSKGWQELPAADYLDADLDQRAQILAGEIESYRVVKKFIHADGRSIWGDLAVSGIRGEDGQVETFVSQITDITAEVEGRQLLARRSGENMLLAQSLLRQTERLTADLRSAAAYVESTLPVGLDGPVQVSSYYLPSQELGGDCFDYRWVDDDHLVVYVIDVSGHGIEPALLSISVHNMLRSDALPLRTLLVPDRVLAELNRRFQMDQHGQHFFTMWFGVYQASTRTLRYASAGAPPAFAFTSGDGATPVPDLSTDCAPVGMFEDTVFTSSAYSVPPGCRILLYSDGAYELDLGDGQQLSLDDFRNLTARHASSPDSTLDGLVEELLALTPSHIFLDDCSLIELTVH